MPTSLNLLFLDQLPIFEQLQIEEALLRADDSNWCIINTGSSDAIVMGISGHYEHLINETVYSKQPVPIIRRFSGGGTVFVDKDTYFITFICNAKEVGVPCYPQHVLQWTEKLYETVFPTGFSLIENDYAIEKKKFGGNAQYFRKERWLHHSSLLWDYSENKMSYLQIPKKAPKYREKRDHSEFLCRLKDFVSRKTFEKQLLDTLKSQFLVKEVNKKKIEEHLDKPHRKATAHVKIPSKGD